MTTHPELTTIKDFIRFAATSFNQADLYFGHGTDSAWDEAAALVLHSIKLPHDIHPSAMDAHLIESERKQLFDLIHERIEKRIPLPYLTHEAWFSGLSFYVDERVLIPRSPIAELIERQFQPWIAVNKVHDILDLCTGSGCIAIACASYFPDAQIDASDVSPDALAVAKINVLRHHLEGQVELIHSNLFEQLPQKKYDIIISNPPYVSADEMLALPKEYHHEPALGLEAGQLGLDIVTRILDQAKQYLHPHGILITEVGNSEYALAEAFPHVPFTWIECERGGGGVFMLTAEQLRELSF